MPFRSSIVLLAAALATTTPSAVVVVAIDHNIPAARGVVRGTVAAATSDASGGIRQVAVDPQRQLKMKKPMKPKKEKKTKSTSAPSAAPTAPPDNGLQDGYEFGMKKEIEGYWAGEEKFSSADCPGPFDYCSTAIFDPRGPIVDGVVDPQNFLVFQSGYIGDTGNKTCLSEAGVNLITGDVDGNWLRTLDPFNYILQIEQKKCLDQSECPYKVVEDSGMFDNYEVLEESCGAHLKTDKLTNAKNCELYHVSLLEEKTTGEQIVVNVLSYTGGFDSYGDITCPVYPTFDLDVMNSDPNMDGILLFVKQGCIDTSDDASGCVVTDTSNWECKF